MRVPMNRLKRLLITLAVAGGLVAVGLGLRVSLPWLLAQYWQSRLDTASDAQAAVLLARVAKLDEPGIPVLVESLDSPRASVARAGKRALLNQLNHWNTLHAQDASPKLACLADILAEHVHDFGPAARGDASELAMRILRQPLDPKVVDRDRVVSSCGKVLRATTLHRRWPPDGLPLDRAEHVAWNNEPAGATAARPSRERAWLAEHAPSSELTKMPGGDLPISILPASPSAADVPSLGAAGQKPRWFAGGSGARPLKPPRPLKQPSQPRRLPEEVDNALRPLEDSTARRPAGPGIIRPLALEAGVSEDDSPAADSGGPLRRGVSGVETLELVLQLRSEDERTVADARSELSRRGFTDVHFELGLRLSDPDPEARKQLVRLLPSLRSVDPEPWLLWLGRDRSAEVRLAAISLLATSTDPALLAKVERIARTDTDPRIRRQADRIARRRGRDF